MTATKSQVSLPSEDLVEVEAAAPAAFVEFPVELVPAELEFPVESVPAELELPVESVPAELVPQLSAPTPAGAVQTSQLMSQELSEFISAQYFFLPYPAAVHALSTQEHPALANCVQIDSVLPRTHEAPYNFSMAANAPEHSV